MKNLFRFLIVSLLFSCRNSDNSFLVEDVIDTGEYSYEIISPYQKPELLELVSKFQNAIQQDFNWFVNYSENDSNRDTNNRLKYHEKLGITALEQDRMMQLFDEITYKVVDSSFVNVINKDGFLSFYHSDPMDILNFLRINLNQNRAIFDSLYLEFDKYSLIEDSNNAFQSGWEGVSWYNEQQDSADLLSLDMEKVKTLNHSSQKVQIGKLFSNDRVFLTIEIKEIHNGEVEKYEQRILFK